MKTSTITPTPLSRALTNLQIHLGTLPSSGAQGFEGLMRDLMEQITGMAFRLSKSGHQHGIDVRSQATNAIEIGLEAKRYLPNSYLQLDELKQKIYDALSQPEPVDVWILAATREITDNDKDALVVLGDKHGLAVIVIDWTKSAAGLPRMAVLCAAAPDICANFLGSPPGLKADLVEIAAHPDFANKLAQLKQDFAAADVGFAAATIVLRHWMDDAQNSNSNAKSRLQGPNNLTEPNVVLVHRMGVTAALDQWWQDPTNLVAVLLGDEGNGKTWSALDWSHALDPQAALTLYIPARTVDPAELLDTICEALARRTRLRDTAFWKMRLAHWAQNGRVVPPILVILDGIDQNWTCNWVDLLQPLLDPAYSGLFRFLMTCRPDPWAELGGLPALHPAAHTINVEQFSTAELDRLLALAGLSRSQFEPNVLQLMRTPRLSLLAIKNRDKLADTGDITAERLIYEDWKHRLENRRGQHISDADFQKFIQGLGQDLRSAGNGFSMTRSEILTRLIGHSGKSSEDVRNTVSEIVNGRWLTPDTHDRHKFVIQKQLAPYALGLALVGELQGTLTAAEVDSRIADLMDELKGQSLGVSVLRAAMTVALLDKRVERPARQGILERWLSEQNFSTRDFDAMWRMVGLDLDLFCDLIEQKWLNPADGAFIDEILIKGAARVYEFPEVAPRLRARITSWAGWVWSDPWEGRFLGQIDLTTPDSLARQSVTRTNLAQWIAKPSARWPMIELRDVRHLSWFSHRVIGILSYLPRAPFVDALIAWALGRSIMNEPRQFEELAWLLRLNGVDADDARAAVLTAVDALEKDGSQIARRAAGWLLEALGDDLADARAEALRAALLKDFGVPCHPAQERKRLPNPGAISPDATVQWDAVHDRMPDGAKLSLYLRDRGDEDIRFTTVLPKLARINLPALRQIYLDAAASASTRSDAELQSLARLLPEFFYLLCTNVRTQLQQEFSNRATVTTDNDVAKHLRSAANLIDMWGKPSNGQIAALAGHLPQALDGIPLSALSRLNSADWPHVRDLIDATTDPASLRLWMQYLDHVGRISDLKDWPGLATLILYSDPIIREKALGLTWQSHNPHAIRVWAESGWTAEEQNDRKLIALGSGVLMLAQLDLGIAVKANRTHMETVAYAVLERPDGPEQLDAFEAYFKEQIERSGKPGARSLPQYWRDHSKAVLTLLKARKDSLLPWIKTWLDSSPQTQTALLFDDFPMISLCRALLAVDPDVGIAFWQTLSAQLGEGIIKRDGFFSLLLEAESTPTIDAACLAALQGLKTDQELLDFATTAERCKRTSWLIAEITRMAAASLPLDRALAYQLAGYLDYSPESNSLWAALPKPAAHARWLGQTYDAAKASFETSRFAHHWHQRFLEATDRTEAAAALELFFLSADRRAQNWVRADFDKAAICDEKRAHWRINISRLNAAIKKSRDAKKTLLFGDRIMDQTQAPWR